MDPVSGADDVPAGTPDDPDRSGGAATTDGAIPVAPGSLGAHPERHPDDLPPAEPGGRRLPAGVLWAVALALVVLVIASWTAFSNDTAQPDPDVVRLGDPSLPVAPGLGDTPDVVGQPIPSTPYTAFDGSTTSLAAHAGKPMVVNFWASSCAPCIEEMPAFEAVHQDLGDDVTFVGLAVTDGETPARALAERTGVSYDLGFDPLGQIIIGSGGVVLPTTVFVAADGTILETHHKVLDQAGLRERIDHHFDLPVS